MTLNKNVKLNLASHSKHVKSEEGFSFVYQFEPKPAPVITCNMLRHLECERCFKPSLPVALKSKDDTKQPVTTDASMFVGKLRQVDEKPEEPKYKWSYPQLMIIFATSDINCALHRLLQSLHDPFAINAVATLLLEECLLEVFLSRIQNKMHKLHDDIANHGCYVRSLAKLAELKPRVVVGNTEHVPANATPMFVLDMPHRYLGEGPTGVITLHIFRTAKEATTAHLKETVPFNSVSIWNEKLGNSYEIAARMNLKIVFFNCVKADLSSIKNALKAHKSDARIWRGYHYETLKIKKMLKCIIYPLNYPAVN